jgi:hypothetical protein
MSETMPPFNLTALDGANPLGFLAALGTLAVLSETDPHIKLGWHLGARWTPFLTSPNPLEKAEVLQCLATRLRGKPVDAEKEKLRDAAQKRFDAAKKEFKNAVDQFKKRGLRGKERDAARATDIVPHELARKEAQDNGIAVLFAKLPHRIPEGEAEKRAHLDGSGTSVGMLAAGERSGSNMKRLAEWGKKRRDRRQAPTEAQRDCVILKPERTCAERSGRTGARVRSRRGERVGSDGFWSRKSVPSGLYVAARWMI